LQGYPQILGGGSHIRVAQQDLDGAEIGAGIEHVGSAGVAEQVRVNQMLDAGTVSSIAAQDAEGMVVERLIRTLFRRKQNSQSVGCARR
jgi:hypothetical protein